MTILTYFLLRTGSTILRQRVKLNHSGCSMRMDNFSRFLYPKLDNSPKPMRIIVQQFVLYYNKEVSSLNSDLMFKPRAKLHLTQER